MQSKAIHGFLDNLVSGSEEWMEHLHLYVAHYKPLYITLNLDVHRMARSLVVNITYDVERKTFDHPYILLSEKTPVF